MILPIAQVYGIPNCNTVKKALDWLRENQIEFSFHDFKKEGISAAKLKYWAKMLKWQNLLNKKGTTWRTLNPAEQTQAINQKGALQLMQLKTSLIKRPIIEWPDGDLSAGFDEAIFEIKKPG